MERMRSSLLPLLAVALMVSVSGCVMPTVKQTVPFDEDAFKPYAGSGTASVVGSAFMKTQGGEVKVGAGDTVNIFPQTHYTQERIQLTQRGAVLEPPDY